MPKPLPDSAQQTLDLASILLTPDSRAVEMVMIFVDRDVVDRYKAMGPGWKARMQDVLDQAAV